MNQKDPLSSIVGRRIGPYKIIREIGHGGMGAVYLAVRIDEQFEQRAAIKLVKPGMDTDEILRRFRTERQILANLKHPNVATLLDGGTTEDGLPYFVMDYVEGTPIDQYCDQHKLSIEERLALFRTVCSAVQYAHQNLVVHRDIKPGNILVTAEGVPILLDFGIAKLLNPTLPPQTMVGFGPMTPDFASPEQVRGEPITTSSDVYSLGILLYVLLTGHRPYRFKSYHPNEIAQVICYQDPEKPSTAIRRIEETGTTGGAPTVAVTPETVSTTRGSEPGRLRRLLAGDLDTIILKAMHKEAGRRYPTVDQFSDDIRRYLMGLPVSARKDTLSYRALKFIRRNTLAVTAAGLVAMALLGGIIATTWEAHVAERERAKAERRFDEVRQLADSLMFEVNDAITNMPGSTPARSLLVRRALEYLDKLGKDAGDDPALQRDLAMAYQKMGDVQGNPFLANLGDSAGARSSYGKALTIRRRLVEAHPKDVQDRRDLASSYDSVGDMLWATSDLAGALDNYRQSLAIREGLLKDSSETQSRHDLAMSDERIGDTLAKKGDFNAALEKHRDALAIRELLARQTPGDAAAQRALSVSYGKVGEMLAMTGNAAVALDNFRKSLAIREALSAKDPKNIRARRELALSYVDVGDELRELGETAGVLENYQKALAIRESLSSVDPTNVQARRDLAIIYGTLGDALSWSGNKSGAVDYMLKSLAMFKALSVQDRTNRGAQEDLGICYENLAAILVEINDFRGATENYQSAIGIFETLVVEDPMNAGTMRRLAIAYGDRGALNAKLAAMPSVPLNRQVELWREARGWYQKSLNTLRDIQKRGILTGSEPLKAGEMAAEIARCEEALAKLQGRGGTSR